MMRRQLRAFRPWLADLLEARAVPATLGLTTPVGVLGISVTLPSQVPTTSTQVQKAFAAFDQSYINAVDDILLAPTANGVVVPSANRAAFNSAVEQSLETLAQQLVLSVTSTSASATALASTTSSVSSEVVSAIVGTGSTSLESQLLAVSTATIELNLANVTSVGTTSSTPLANVVSTAEQVRPTTRVPDTESTGLSTLSTGSTSTSSSSSKVASEVRSAFGNFLNDYFQAVQTTLLATGTNGQVNPAANRAAFDAQVNQALQSLETRLATTLGRSPATSGLTPEVQAALAGNNASSLKTQLNQLATPTSTQAAVVRDFTLGSTQAIAQALSLISGDVASLFNPAGN